jgi:hypothetical protein
MCPHVRAASADRDVHPIFPRRGKRDRFDSWQPFDPNRGDITVTTSLRGHFPDADTIISTDFNSTTNEPVVTLKVETFLTIAPEVGAMIQAMLAAGDRPGAFQHLLTTRSIPAGNSKGHAMLRAAFDVVASEASDASSRSARAARTETSTLRGHFPDADFVIREDTDGKGTTTHSFSIETTVVINDSAALGRLRAELKDTSPDGRRKAYETLHGLTKADIGEKTVAHAVVQAAFKQIEVDPGKIPP